MLFVYYPFTDGYYLLLRPEVPIPSALVSRRISQTSLATTPILSPWSLSGPQYKKTDGSVDLQQRYCAPKGESEYCTLTKGSLWTQVTSEGEDFDVRVLHVYKKLPKRAPPPVVLDSAYAGSVAQAVAQATARLKASLNNSPKAKRRHRDEEKSSHPSQPAMAKTTKAAAPIMPIAPIAHDPASKPSSLPVPTIKSPKQKKPSLAASAASKPTKSPKQEKSSASSTKKTRKKYTFNTSKVRQSTRVWTIEEDMRLARLIGEGRAPVDVTKVAWNSLAESMESRNGKQCRERVSLCMMTCSN